MYYDVYSLCSNYTGAQMVWNKQIVLNTAGDAVDKIHCVIWSFQNFVLKTETGLWKYKPKRCLSP